MNLHWRIAIDRMIESPLSVVSRVVHGLAVASRLALKGLAAAVVMGVVFGLVIGIGGTALGVETERLSVIGGFSGWISGSLAMVFVFVQMRRTRHSGH
jgi:hypothetical protein